MMKLLLYSLLLPFALSICTSSSGQTNAIQKNNSISFEIGKNGLIYNLSFDRKLKNKPIGYRFFAGSNFGKHLTASTGGAGFYFLKGSKNDKLEIGADISYLVIDEVSDDQKGFTILVPDESIKTYYASLNIGFRHYAKNILFRIGLSPGFIKTRFLPGAYIRFGITF
jgi:hypothetical protein